MNNEIIISNIDPQDIVIGEGGATGITTVYVNGVDVTDGNVAYVIVPTKTSELINDSGYLTYETDPTIPYYIKEISISDINKWNNKQDQLVSGQNIRTINNQSLLGSGNLDIETSYTAGDGIEITSENVINNTITSYNDLSDLPTIPTKTSDLTNDSDFVTGSSLSNVAYSGSYLDLSNTPDLGEYATLDTIELENYFTKELLYKLLPKVSGSGEEINLNNTVENAPLYLTLNATELSQDATPTPDSPQDIHTISGSNKVVVCGKNFISISTNCVITGGPIVIDLENLVPAGTYTISITEFINGGTTKGLIHFLDSSNNQMAYVALDNSNKTATITVSSPIAKLRLYSQNSAGASTGITSTYVGLMASISGGDYEPYTSQEADIDLGDLEYCKISTYADEFIRDNEGNWQLKKNIGKVVLDGTENWGTNASWNYTNTNCYIYSWNLAPTTMLSNYFKYNSNAFSNDVSGQMGIVWGGSLLLRIDKTLASDSTAFKTWLTTHNTTIMYPLSTPTYTQITGTLETQLEQVYKNMLSQAGQTNISQVNNDLPFIITAETLKDISNL